MTKHHAIIELPEYAAACLTCACRNHENQAGQRLVARTNALTATGVLAAIFIADSVEHVMIVKLARLAIAEQREYCAERATPVPAHCTRPPARLLQLARASR